MWINRRIIQAHPLNTDPIVPQSRHHNEDQFMRALDRLKIAIRQNPLLKVVVYRPLILVLNNTVRREQARATKVQWDQRHRDVQGCPDNQNIPRVPDAGRIVGGLQTMHNGIKIRRGSYYGSEVTHLLEANKGVHEPQEEWVFQEVLPHVPGDGVILELGAYWGFYSAWFLSGLLGTSVSSVQTQTIRRAFLVEPEPENLKMGQDNFRLNNLHGEFLCAFVGSKPGKDDMGRRIVCVDELVRIHSLDRVHILHCDIQGYEMDMLDGAADTLAARKVDYVFISTHSQDLHERCRQRLIDSGMTILADADMNDTYSFDGLIVGRRTELKGVETVTISKKSVHGLV